jgi:hypothetical protein
MQVQRCLVNRIRTGRSLAGPRSTKQERRDSLSTYTNPDRIGTSKRAVLSDSLDFQRHLTEVKAFWARPFRAAILVMNALSSLSRGGFFVVEGRLFLVPGSLSDDFDDRSAEDSLLVSDGEMYSMLSALLVSSVGVSEHSILSSAADPSSLVLALNFSSRRAAFQLLKIANSSFGTCLKYSLTSPVLMQASQSVGPRNLIVSASAQDDIGELSLGGAGPYLGLGDGGPRLAAAIPYSTRAWTFSEHSIFRWPATWPQM